MMDSGTTGQGQNNSSPHSTPIAWYKTLFLRILCYLYFTDNDNKTHKNNENYESLWKTRQVFDMVNVAYSKFLNPSEHLATDEVIVLFKGMVAFKQYIPKKHTCFGIKIYKLSDRTGYTCDMEVYIQKVIKHAIMDMTVTHARVEQLTIRV